MFIPKMVFNMPVTTSVQINPIPAGLENQDTLGGGGGGQFDANNFQKARF